MMADNGTSARVRQLRSRFLPCSSSKRRRIHSTESNPTAAAICKLDDDLLVEILIRLPNPRSACRCKLVCKRWSSLIFDPVRFSRRFVSHHRSRNQPPPPPLIILSDDPQSIITSFLPLTTLSRMSFVVLDSYKDLVLCGFPGLGPTSGELYRSYFLCNPFTKQWIALPLAPEWPKETSISFARLVCEPRISNDFDLGEYRFRVVCLYQHLGSTKLDVFCSDTGGWTKEVLVRHRQHKQFLARNVVSCNGEVFWTYGVRNQDPGAVHQVKPFVAAFNPFRPDIPPTAIDVPQVFGKPGWDISVSQGALHLIVFEDSPEQGRAQIASSVWRLEDDHKSWRKVCAGLLRSSALYEVRPFFRPNLHPEKPEVVFFCHMGGHGELVALSCDLGTGGELELFTEGRELLPCWRMFKVESACWPSSIARYKELRVMYDGSCSCWVQSNDEPSRTPSIAGMQW